MIEIDDVQASIREHLLGRVKGEEREPFEERFISDPEFREVVLLIESELFDDYAANLLSDVDRDSFVGQYVNSPSRNKDVQFITALRDQAVELEQPAVIPQRDTPRLKESILDILKSKHWIPLLASGTLAVVVLFVLWSVVGKWLSPDQTPDFSSQVALVNKQPRGNEPLFPIPLQPIQRGPGEGPKISIPTEKAIVELQCRLPENSHRAYEATLRVVNGAEVFRVDQLQLQDTPNGKTVDLRIPAHILTPQDYIFSVKGLTAEGKLEDVADYFFRIVK